MRSDPRVQRLLQKHPLISDQVDERELAVILGELVHQVERSSSEISVVELGCYVGTTSLFVRRVLDMLESSADFHVYDSFIGLPDKSAQDQSPAGEQFRTGELAVSRKDFERQFKKAGLRLPRIHKGWFSDMTSGDIPDRIGFAYLDGDYYESIKNSLSHIASKLTPEATIVVDDYANLALPGAKRAVDEWLQGRNATLRVEASLAVIYLTANHQG